MKDYVDSIRGFYLARKRMPSYSEMLGLFSLKSKNAVAKRVAALVREGFLEKDPTGRILPGKRGRGVRMLGAVAAGFPSPAEEELRDVMSIDEYLIANPQATYLLKVDGESMIDAGLHPGDLILVQRGLTPRPGDIVVARIDNEWTLKFFEKKGGRVFLKAANAKYPAIVPRQELVVAGVVIGCIRKYR